MNGKFVWSLNFNFCKRFLDLDLWGLNRNKGYLTCHSSPCLEYEFILQDTVNFHNWMSILFGRWLLSVNGFLDLNLGPNRNKGYLTLFSSACPEHHFILQDTVNFTTECQFCLVVGVNFNFCKRFLDLNLWGFNRNKSFLAHFSLECNVILQHTVNFHKWMSIIFGCSS